MTKHNDPHPDPLPSQGEGGENNRERGGSCRAVGLALFLVELNEGKYILPDQTANRAGAVHTDSNRAIRPQHIAGAVEDLAPLFIEAAGHLGNHLVISAIAHREVDAAFVDGLFGFFLRVHGGCNNLYALVLESIGSRESGQLLLAIGSPVTPVQ